MSKEITYKIETRHNPINRTTSNSAATKTSGAPNQFPEIEKN